MAGARRRRIVNVCGLVIKPPTEATSSSRSFMECLEDTRRLDFAGIACVAR
ncbi:hypothetical protein PC114_g14946 [Phytophthora cactorum]|nr:hypothetical protein PC114_g14946 [Phytophthora cactorum]